MTRHTHGAGAHGPREPQAGHGSPESGEAVSGPRIAFSWDDVMLGVVEYANFLLGTAIVLAGSPQAGVYCVAVAIYLRLQRKL